jgi:GNAT superfamily N-acetyltransferase
VALDRGFTMDEIRYVECDPALKRRVGETLGVTAERHIRLDDGFALVALDADRPVGVIAVYRRSLPDPLTGTSEGFINIIEIAATHRRRGIGRRLVEMAIERCRSLRLHQVRAWSSEDKAEAIRMWRSLGFALCPAVEHPRGRAVRGYFAALQL